MNEDGTPIEVSTDNIAAADGGVTTTPEEIAQLLNLPAPQKEVEAEEEAEEEEAVEKTPEELAAEKQAEDDKLAAEEDERTKQAEAQAKTEKQPEKQTTQDDAPVFELEVEDANGEKYTLKPDDRLEDVLKDFEPKNNGQIFQIIDDLQKLRSEKTAFDEKTAQESEEAAHKAQIDEIQGGWNKEIEALQGQKRLEVTGDGKQSERVNEVFKFMGEENAKRMEDGRPLLSSFEDALDKLELRETREAEKQKAKEEKELQRKKGGMVGGSSAPVTNAGPVYKGGARNANEAIRSLGLLK